MQTAVAAGTMAGPPADPSQAWSLLGMGFGDRQMLNLTAMDALTRRFRERMAGALVARPVDTERLAEVQPEPQIPVAEAVGGDGGLHPRGAAGHGALSH